MKTLEERIEELKIINASYNCACMSYYDLEPALEIIAELQDKIQNFEKVTRVEAIDEYGRSYVNHHPRNKINVQLQDEGRTMKIFIEEK